MSCPITQFLGTAPGILGSVPRKMIAGVIPEAPEVCKITAFMAIIMGLGLLFYILLGFR